MKRVMIQAVVAVLGAGSMLAQQVPSALQTRPRWTISTFQSRLPSVQKLDLTPDQKKSIDDIYQQHRLKLIDLEAALQKEDLILEPLVNANPPDDAKVLAQIDRVAQARAELEKANSRMLWQVRRVLTPDQWNQLSKQPTVTVVPPVKALK